MPKKQPVKNHLKTVKKRVNKRVKLAVVPHKANNYRPLAIRRYGIITILVMVIAAQAIYNGFSSGNVLGAEAQITSGGLLDATNQERAANGKQPLVINPELSRAAHLKVQSMFAAQYWSHTAPDGTTPWHWFDVVSYKYDSAGENLAKDFSTSDSTVAAWMASPTHRANILNGNYKDVGFAAMNSVLDGEPTTLIVALYASPENSQVQGATMLRDASDINEPMSIMSRMGIGLQAMTPAAISSIVVLLVAMCVALAAHLYRKKLPRSLRRGWYRHHGIYKAIGFASLALIIVFAYGSGGQI